MGFGLENNAMKGNNFSTIITHKTALKGSKLVQKGMSVKVREIPTKMAVGVRD